MAMGMLERIASEKVPGLAIDAEYKFVKKRFIARCLWKTLSILRPKLRKQNSRYGHF